MSVEEQDRQHQGRIKSPVKEFGGEEQESVSSPVTADASLGDRGAPGVGVVVLSHPSTTPPCDGHVITGEMYLPEAKD